MEQIEEDNKEFGSNSKGTDGSHGGRVYSF
jgi:hypothetical protein